MCCQKGGFVADIGTCPLKLLVCQRQIKADNDYIRHRFCQTDPIFPEIFFQIRRSQQVNTLPGMEPFQIFDHHIPGCENLLSRDAATHRRQLIHIAFGRPGGVIGKKYELFSQPFCLVQKFQ